MDNGPTTQKFGTEQSEAFLEKLTLSTKAKLDAIVEEERKLDWRASRKDLVERYKQVYHEDLQDRNSIVNKLKRANIFIENYDPKEPITMQNLTPEMKETLPPDVTPGLWYHYTILKDMFVKSRQSPPNALIRVCIENYTKRKEDIQMLFKILDQWKNSKGHIRETEGQSFIKKMIDMNMWETAVNDVLWHKPILPIAEKQYAQFFQHARVDCVIGAIKTPFDSSTTSFFDSVDIDESIHKSKLDTLYKAFSLYPMKENPASVVPDIFNAVITAGIYGGTQEGTDRSIEAWNFFSHLKQENVVKAEPLRESVVAMMHVFYRRKDWAKVGSLWKAWRHSGAWPYCRVGAFYGGISMIKTNQPVRALECLEIVFRWKATAPATASKSTAKQISFPRELEKQCHPWMLYDDLLQLIESMPQRDDRLHHRSLFNKTIKKTINTSESFANCYYDRLRVHLKEDQEVMEWESEKKKAAEHDEKIKKAVL